MESLETFYNAIRKEFNGDETVDQLGPLIQSSWTLVGNDEPLSDSDVAELIDRLRADTSPDTPLPGLLVDWGKEPPRIGYQARPQFMLLCPDGYSKRPTVDVVVDHSLDSDGDAGRDLQAESKGVWEFFVPFGLTTDRHDCRPGDYLLELKLRFPVLANRSLPRFFHCTIRLHIPPADESGERELVIDGDGQSIVNLCGQDLKSFGRVVLKGGDKALINLQQGATPDEEPAEDTEVESPSITHSYQLKVDQTHAKQIPFRSRRFSSGQRLESAMLELGSQKRWLLLPKRRARWNWTFGRNRDNDVITRFLPRSEENDTKTSKLSRRHLELELTDAGLQFPHRSGSGVCLDRRPIGDDDLLTKVDAGAPHMLELGDPLGSCFELDLYLFAQPDDPFQRAEQQIRNTLCYEALEEPLQLLRHAEASQIDTVLLTRTDELEHQEAYVLLCRHASIGGSEFYSSIAIDDDDAIQQDHARILYARRTFWLENRTSDPSLVLINGDPLPPLELAPLSCEMELTFGSTTTMFDRAAQLHL